MREVLTSVLVLGLLFATAACTEDTTRPDTDVVPLKIDNIQLSGVSLRSSDPLESGDIGLFRLAGDGYSGTSNNVKYTYSGGGWSAASGVTPIYLSKSTANLCAYYPYSSDADYSDGQVTLTSQRYDNTKDLCYQTGVTASSEAAASFTLEHAYSMITFTLTRSATYPGACAISNLSLANAGLLTSNTLDMTTGTTGTYGSGTTGTITVSPSIAGIASGSSETVSVLMVPVTTSMSGDIQLSLTVDGRALSTTISTTTLPKLEAGKNYAIAVSINGASLTITSVTTTDWADVMAGTVNNTLIAEEANCYMLPLGETVYIPVSRVETAWTQINGSAYTLPTAWTAALLWTDNSYGVSPSGSIAAISYNRDGKYIKVTAGMAEGNSVIVLYDNDGTTIQWSWHIWVTENPSTEIANGYTWMDRNLGSIEIATNTPSVTFATCGGLMYQWGRKDPFPGSDGLTTGSATAKTIYNQSGAMTSASISWPSDVTTTSTGTNNDVVKYANASLPPISYTYQAEYSVKNPLLFLTNWAGSSATSLAEQTTAGGMSSWGGEFGESKTIFDPCPSGWRVPSGKRVDHAYVSPWSTWTTIGSFTTSPFVSVLWNTTGSLYSYPTIGWRHTSTGAIDLVGANGYYWCATSNGNTSYCMAFYSGNIPVGNILRARAVPVRCVEE